jgi:hypothetical protein
MIRGHYWTTTTFNGEAVALDPSETKYTPAGRDTLTAGPTANERSATILPAALKIRHLVS